jgi:hypothetical protein
LNLTIILPSERSWSNICKHKPGESYNLAERIITIHIELERINLKKYC